MKKRTLILAIICILAIILAIVCAGLYQESPSVPQESTPNGTTVGTAGNTDPTIMEPTQPTPTEPTQPTPTEPTQPTPTEPTQPTPTEPTQPAPTEPVHTHSYAETVIAPTCTENGYTIHKCACGEEYKDSEVTAKGHTYTDTTIAPTCENGGRTVHKCSCGYEYSDTETAALGHQYSDMVVDPTASEQGYTEHVCKICGFTYRDNYKDKLPPEETDPGKDYDDGHGMVDAGVFGKHSSKTAPVYNGSTDYDSVVNTLNSYIFDVYGFRYFRNGMAKNYGKNEGTAKIVQDGDGKFGVTILDWRHGYDSGAVVNSRLNTVLETFYYFTGSKDVAYRLWSLVDKLGINGASSIQQGDFGFTISDIDSKHALMTYGSCEIVWDWSNGNNVFWFNYKDDDHSGDHLEAGTFAFTGKAAPVYSGSGSYADVIGDINGYVGNVYDYRFYSTGIGKNDNGKLGTAMIVQNSSGQFGITVYGWRHSYDSDSATNKVLNVVLEAMRYFAKGKSDVAYALWSFCDYKNINGSANSDNFGFHDVEKTSIGWIIEMNGVQILLDNTVSGETTYWFI